MDKKLINLLLLIDFKKAFDLVNPKLLFVKLLNYGFQNSAVKLMTNYFDKRLQAVKINNVNSAPLLINLGVPQGSILGPLLFLVYINDLPAYLNGISSKLFADDTTLDFADHNIESVINCFKKGLSPLLDCCSFNYLYINWDKTNVLFITSRRLILPEFVQVENIKIQVVEKFKLLGVTIDSRLTFLDHVSNLTKSINTKLFAIKRIFYLSFNVKIQFFKTF